MKEVKPMKNSFVKILALMLCCICLFSCVSVAFADTYTTTIKFTDGRSVYGPSTAGYYHKKGNNNQSWSAQYVSGWNAITGIYLYDREYGDCATHTEDLTRGAAPSTGLQYLGTACCQSSHHYKVVAKRDISNFSGAYDFVYTWTM